MTWFDASGSTLTWTLCDDIRLQRDMEASQTDVLDVFSKTAQSPLTE